MISGATADTADVIVSSGAEALPWEAAMQRLAAAGTFWMATVREDGLPHVRPILAVWVDGSLHFAMSTSSRKWANARRSAGCSVAAETPGLDIVVEGVAVWVTIEARLRRVADVYASRYDWTVEVRDGAFFADGAPTAGPPPFHVYDVRPATVYGFGTDDEHAPRSTRWRFTPRTEP